MVKDKSSKFAVKIWAGRVVDLTADRVASVQNGEVVIPVLEVPMLGSCKYSVCWSRYALAADGAVKVL